MFVLRDRLAVVDRLIRMTVRVVAAALDDRHVAEHALPEPESRMTRFHVRHQRVLAGRPALGPDLFREYDFDHFVAPQLELGTYAQPVRADIEGDRGARIDTAPVQGDIEGACDARVTPVLHQRATRAVICFGKRPCGSIR